MAKHWQEKIKALQSLDYFNFFTEKQIQNACTIGQLRQFNPLDTIYQEDKGSFSFVYFVISGECMIVQRLNMIVKQRGKVKSFKLINWDNNNMPFCSLATEEPQKMLHKSENSDKLELEFDFGNLLIDSVINEDNKIAAQRPIIKHESHFIDVGSLTFGGIFGLGEKIEDRSIMARTTVQCLMFPRYWLFEKIQNPGNIWQRRRLYIDCTIPTRETLFQDFLKTRRWQKFKHEYIQSNLSKRSSTNDTKADDIPFFCRIMETTEYSNLHD